MCDQTEVKYVPGDIVWVKLSNVWWPAEVQDITKLDEEVTAGLKRTPLAVVKFFDEDTYEYPKHLNQIYHYNCIRKDEFIKKGLDLYRTESNRDTYMKKFPDDVKFAERKTGGNPEYINDSKFLPEEKIDYREKIGLKPLKKMCPERTESLAKSPSNYKTSPKVTFSLAPSNSGASEFLSPTKKKSDSSQKKIKTSSGVPVSVLKSPKSSKKTPLSYFPCHFCAVFCDRVESIIAHMKFHLKGILPPAPSGFPNHQFEISERNLMGTCSNSTSTPGSSDKKSAKKRKSSVPIVSDTPKMKKVDLVNEDNKFVSPPPSILSNSVNSSTPKKLPRAKKQKVVKENNGQTAALESLLLDWEEEPTIDENVESSPEKDSVTTKNIDDSDQTIVCESVDSSKKQENSSLSLVSHSENKSPEKSCFDFEDNEDALNLDQSLKFGQKLPRVINDKQSSTGRFKQDLKTENAQDVLSKDVDNFLDSVEMPNIPEIPSLSIPISTTLQVKKDEFCASSGDIKTEDIKKDELLSDNLIISPTKEPQGNQKSDSISPLIISTNLKPSSSGNDKASSNSKNSANCDVPSLSGKSDEDFLNINLTGNQLMLKKPCDVSDLNKPCSVVDKPNDHFCKAGEPISTSDDTVISNEFQKEDSQMTICTDNMTGKGDVSLKLPLTCIKSVEIAENKSLDINNTTNKDSTDKDNVCKSDNINSEMLKNVDDDTKLTESIKNESGVNSGEDNLICENKNTPISYVTPEADNEGTIYSSENKNEEIQEEPIINETNITCLLPSSLSNTSENSEVLIETISSSSLCKPAEDDSVKKIPLNDKTLKITSKEESENKTNVLASSQALSSISRNNDDQENESVMKADRVPNQSLTDDLSGHLNSSRKRKGKSDLIQENLSVQSSTNVELNRTKDNSKLIKHNSSASIKNKDTLSETKDSVDGTASSFNKSVEKTENVVKRRKTEKCNSSAENDSKDNCRKHNKQNSSPTMQERDLEDKQNKTNLYTPPGVTDVSEIPLPQDIYPKKAELPKDVKKEEINPELKEKSYAPLVSDQPLDINSMPFIIADDSKVDMEIFCGRNIRPPKELIANASQIITVNIFKKGEERLTPGKVHLFNINLSPTPPPDFVPACPDSTILSLLNPGNQPSTSSSSLGSEEKPSCSTSIPHRKVKSSEIKSHIPNTGMTNISSSGKHPISSKHNVKVLPHSSRQKVVLASSSASGPHQPPGPSKPPEKNNQLILPKSNFSTLPQSKNSSGTKKVYVLASSQSVQKSEKPLGSEKNSTSFMQIPVSERNIVAKINRTPTLQPDRRTIPPKIKHSSPNILQRTSKKVVRQVVTNKASIPPLQAVQSIVANEPTGNVLYLSVDNDSISTNSIIPIQCTTENSGLIDSTNVISFGPSTASRNLNNIILMGPNNFVNIENANVSRAQKPETDILAKALEDTQVLQPDSSDLGVYQQFPTSLTSSVSETSLTLNQPIMSPLEVPSSVNTQKRTPVLKKRIKPEIKPSMPPLDDISIGTTSHTIEFVHEGNILDSSENPSNPGSQMLPTSFLTCQEQPLIAEDVSLSAGLSTEENVLPEFLRGDFDKKSQKSKRVISSQNDDR